MKVELRVGDPNKDGHGRWEGTIISVQHSSFPTREQFIKTFGMSWTKMADNPSIDEFILDMLFEKGVIDQDDWDIYNVEGLDADLFVDLYIKCVNYIDPTIKATATITEYIETKDIGGYGFYMNN